MNESVFLIVAAAEPLTGWLALLVPALLVIAGSAAAMAIGVLLGRRPLGGGCRGDAAAELGRDVGCEGCAAPCPTPPDDPRH